MANELIFKGIQQVKSLPTNPDKGVIYFVREHANGVATGDAKVYFGGRLYGEVAATKISNIESAITSIQETIGDWNKATSTLANAIINVSGTTETNKTDIATLKGTGDGSVAKAVADAKSELLDGAADEYNTLGKLEDKIQEVAKSVTDKNVSATGDTYITASASGNKVTVSATDKTKASLALADTALQVSGITTGSKNGTIAVNNTDVEVKGLGSAAYTEASAYDVSGAAASALTSATKYTNDEIAKLSGTTSGESTDKFVKVEVVETAGKITRVNVTTNDIAKNSDLTTHTGNNDIHVTKAQKDEWTKAKQDIDAFLTAADSGATAIDTLKELQQYIVSDSGATETMLAKISSAQTTANKAVSDIETISGKVNTNITNIASISGAVANNTTAITANTSAIETVNGKITGLTQSFETYTGQTSNVLQSIENRLTAITNNAVTGVTSSNKTINIGNVKNGVVNVEVNTLAHAESGQDGYIILKNDGGALYGVMYYGGDDAE